MVDHTENSKGEIYKIKKFKAAFGAHGVIKRKDQIEEENLKIKKDLAINVENHRQNMIS